MEPNWRVLDQVLYEGPELWVHVDRRVVQQILRYPGRLRTFADPLGVVGAKVRGAVPWVRMDKPREPWVNMGVPV